MQKKTYDIGLEMASLLFLLQMQTKAQHICVLLNNISLVACLPLILSELVFSCLICLFFLQQSL